MVDDAITSLTARVGDRSLTEAGWVGCVMSDHAYSIKTADSFVFYYKPSYQSDTHEIEWQLDTMFVILPPDYVEYLLREGYARLMTAAEADAYNAYIKGEKA